MNRMIRSTSFLTTLAFAVLLTCGVHDVTAQGKPSKSDKIISPASGGSGAVALADDIFRLDAVGLTCRFPVGATINSDRMAGRANIQVIGENKAWVINIQTPATTKETVTIADALKQTVDLIKTSYGIVDPDQKVFYENSTQAKIIEQTDELNLPGGKAARLYVSVPLPERGRVVKGYTIFKPGAKQFVVFEFNVPESAFTNTRIVYETVVSTANFVDAELLNMQRGMAIKAGAAFLASLTETDYKLAMGEGETWYRLYQLPQGGAPVDAKELGYRGVRFWRGQRGEVDPRKSRNSWTTADQQQGYLAQIRGRIVLEGGMGDTSATYFMSSDRNEETWSVVTAFKDKDGKVIAEARETGARLKDEITVVKEETGRPTSHVKPPPTTEGYISQFESYLIPQLMVVKKIETELGFYCYQSQPNGSISFRRDEPHREAGGMAGGKSAWLVKSTIREDMPAQESLFDEAGHLLKTTLDEGRAWEQVELPQLKRLWENKGLPVDK
jgi:hypothetical protein